MKFQSAEMRDRFLYAMYIFGVFLLLFGININIATEMMITRKIAENAANLDFYTENYNKILASYTDSEIRSTQKVRLNLYLQRLNAPSSYESSSDSGLTAVIAGSIM